MSTAAAIQTAAGAVNPIFTAARAAFATMPAEILHEIVSYVGPKTLLALLRVRLLHPYAEPLVYAAIHIGPHHHTTIANWAHKFTLSASRSRKFVRELEIIIDGQVDFPEPAVAKAIWILPNLTALSVKTTSRQFHSSPANTAATSGINADFLAAKSLRRLDIDATVLRRVDVIRILRTCRGIKELNVSKWPRDERVEDLVVELMTAYSDSGIRESHDRGTSLAPRPILPRLNYVEAPAVVVAALLPGRKIRTAVVTDAVTDDLIDLSLYSLNPLSKLFLKVHSEATLASVCDKMTSLTHLSLDNVFQHMLTYWNTDGIPVNMTKLQDLQVLEVDALHPRGFSTPLSYETLYDLDAQLRHKLQSFRRLAVYEYGLFNRKTLLYVTGMAKTPPCSPSPAMTPTPHILVPPPKSS